LLRGELHRFHQNSREVEYIWIYSYHIHIQQPWYEYNTIRIWYGALMVNMIWIWIWYRIFVFISYLGQHYPRLIRGQVMICACRCRFFPPLCMQIKSRCLNMYILMGSKKRQSTRPGGRVARICFE
jgi:hypothetical protein